MHKIFLYVFILFALKTVALASDLEYKSPNSNKIRNFQATNNFLLAGEYDGRTWANPYNGIYYSEDLGESWQPLALEKRAITDLAYEDNFVLAGTYYTVDNTMGLFISSNYGKSFEHSGPKISVSQVEISAKTLYIGGFSHGLWVSSDLGNTWEQKIGNGTGWTGPNITFIKAVNNFVLATTPTTTYISYDYGNTFSQVPQINGFKISAVEIIDNMIILGTDNGTGMYRSTDYGKTWVKINSWGSRIVNASAFFNNKLYIAENNHIYTSTDFGSTWQNTQISTLSRIVELEVVYASPSYLFIVTGDHGIYRYSIPKNEAQLFPFLDIPWHTENSYELIDKITAYFDHEYPLNGYSYYSEPLATKNTTLNFLGNREESPKLYYSSHGGTDYALPLGTPILAASSGYAKYYYCTDCGHSIKIDHLNGYETTYMHLQRDGLISNSTAQQVWVNKGDTIGQVGMTGNTSGPHLHFGVTKDANQNTVFDDFPYGRVDPYGWQSEYLSDPWEYFTWSDSLGNHSGTRSSFLWTYNLYPIFKYITHLDNIINMENVRIIFNTAELENNKFTALASKFIRAKIPAEQAILKYVEGTSISLNIYNYQGTESLSVTKDLEIEYDISHLNFKNIAKDSIKVFFWDELKRKWEPLPTIIDFVAQKVKAKTNHLSHFALLGESLYPNLPLTNINIAGDYNGNFYTQYPEISFTAQDTNGVGLKDTYYSINSGLDWETYEQPFTIEDEGIYKILYRSEDFADNLEQTNEQIIMVNTKFNWFKKIKVTGAMFAIQ